MAIPDTNAPQPEVRIGRADARRLPAAVGLAWGVTVTSMADGHGSRCGIVRPEDADDDARHGHRGG